MPRCKTERVLTMFRAKCTRCVFSRGHFARNLRNSHSICIVSETACRGAKRTCSDYISWKVHALRSFSRALSTKPKEFQCHLHRFGDRVPRCKTERVLTMFRGKCTRCVSSRGHFARNLRNFHSICIVFETACRGAKRNVF